MKMHVSFYFNDKSQFNIFKINNSLKEKVGCWKQIQLPLYVTPQEMEEEREVLINKEDAF